MAKNNTWQERRWKLFLLDYDNDNEFRENILEAFGVYRRNKTDGEIAIKRLMGKKKLPPACYDAIISFLNNPELKESEYIKLIKSPLVINPNSMQVDAARVAKYSLLLLSPHLNKTELKELIDENWEQIDESLKNPRFSLLGSSAGRLDSKIRPTKSRRYAKRDELIRKLYKEGDGDVYIAQVLEEKKLADKNINANRVKQIRFRLGLTNKRKG